MARVCHTPSDQTALIILERRQAIDFIRREVEAASRKRLNARLLVPLTRAQDGASLQFEVELENLDQFEQSATKVSSRRMRRGSG
jgi:hypothetical protein